MRLGIADSKATISKFLQHRLETCQNLIKFDKSLPGFARKSKIDDESFWEKIVFFMHQETSNMRLGHSNVIPPSSRCIQIYL